MPLQLVGDAAQQATAAPVSLRIPHTEERLCTRQATDGCVADPQSVATMRAVVALLLLFAHGCVGYAPCDVANCGCLGVQLGGFSNGEPIMLNSTTVDPLNNETDAHYYLLSMCYPVGRSLLQDCGNGSTAMDGNASFVALASYSGDPCVDIGDTNSMAAEFVNAADGSPALNVRYEHIAQMDDKQSVVIQFTKGTDKDAPVGDVVLQDDGSYLVTWKGLDADPIPPPPPPPPPPAKEHG